MSAMGPFKDITGRQELGSLLQNLVDNVAKVAMGGSAGKATDTKRVMDLINSSPNLDAATKKDLTTKLLTNAVSGEEGKGNG